MLLLIQTTLHRAWLPPTEQMKSVKIRMERLQAKLQSVGQHLLLRSLRLIDKVGCRLNKNSFNSKLEICQAASAWLCKEPRHSNQLTRHSLKTELRWWQHQKQRTRSSCSFSTYAERSNRFWSLFWIMKVSHLKSALMSISKTKLLQTSGLWYLRLEEIWPTYVMKSKIREDLAHLSRALHRRLLCSICSCQMQMETWPSIDSPSGLLLSFHGAQAAQQMSNLVKANKVAKSKPSRQTCIVMASKQCP